MNLPHFNLSLLHSLTTYIDSIRLKKFVIRSKIWLAVGLKLMKLNYLSVGIQFRIVCKMVKIGVFWLPGKSSSTEDCGWSVEAIAESLEDLKKNESIKKLKFNSSANLAFFKIPSKKVKFVVHFCKKHKGHRWKLGGPKLKE